MDIHISPLPPPQINTIVSPPAFDLFPLSFLYAIVVFLYRALSNMRCSEEERSAETGRKRICVHIHPALDSSRSEDSQLGQQAE